MEEEKLEGQDSLTPEGDDDTLKSQEEQDSKPVEEDKFKQLADNYKVRAEKAEKELKEFKSQPKEEKTELPQKDLINLIKEGVTEEEDIDLVKDFATLKKISPSDALKSGLLRTILAEKKEERLTAKATSTSGKREGTSAPSGDELLYKARAGQYPDEDELDALVEARYQSKANKK